MNIQEYISSGIVEAYVLGLADLQECAEFERMCAAHTEVRKAREDFEIALEQQAMQNAVPPAKNTRSKIFAEIEIEQQKRSDNQSAALATNGSAAASEVRTLPAKAVPMGWQRFIAAAAIVLLVISTGFNFYLFNQYRDYSNRYALLLSQQTELAKNNDALRTRLESYENTLAMMRDPNMTVVKMPGTNVPTSPDSASVATVYWNTKSKDVYLMVNYLPQVPSDMQYQLWAIVDGQPVDAGVFDLQTATGLLRMKNMPRADVFAVTLEKRGGSPTPQGPMYVLGKAS